jgi:hypothetical protein
MSLSSAVLLVLLGCTIAAHSSTIAAPCTSSMDCALSGDCVNGACVCDVGWITPKDGPGCSAFDLLPADPANPGYKNESWPSWGGHPVFWPKSKGGDGMWHLFTPQFANECNVDYWVHNSFVIHAVSPNPSGPWEHHDVAIGVW